MAVQASVGFGFGFFAAPAALAALRPAQAVTLLLVLALLLSALVLYAEQRERHIDARATGLLCGWALPGIVAGALVVRKIDAQVLQVAIGVAIVLIALWQARAAGRVGTVRSVQHRGRAFAAGGVCAGAFTTATSLNGPAVILTLTHVGLRRDRLRDTTAASYLVLDVIGTVALAVLAHPGRELPHWPLLAALLPAVAVGHRLGAAAFRRLDAERHTRLVLAAAVVAGTVSVIAGLM